MNKYTAAGLAFEAMNGKDVIVIGKRPSEDMREFDLGSSWVDKVSRANGAEEIRYVAGGRVRFVTEHHRSIAGCRADIVFIDWPVAYEQRDPEFYERLHYVVAERRGEVIRA